MDILISAFFAMIQGLTEFLPISSSGHLVLFSGLYKILMHQEMADATAEEVFFDIILHLGTLFAVVFYFKQEVAELFKGFFQFFKDRNINSDNTKLSFMLIVATVFTVLVAYPLKDFTEKLCSSPKIVSGLLLITGLIIFTSELIYAKRQEKCEKISWKQAITIGIAQGIAAFPGISRSGMTISTGLALGMDRVKSARFSFLLSILIIAGTSILYPILEIEFDTLKQFNWVAIATGFFVSMVTGYLCIKYFMQFLSKFSMKIFAYYCFAVGIIGIIFFTFVK